MKQFIILITLFFSSTALAEEGLYLNLGIGSYHFEQRKDGNSWNQQNHGFGLQYIAPDPVWGDGFDYYFSLGQSRNSEFGLSRYVGAGINKEITRGFLGTLSVGVFTGIMNYPSKYDKESGDYFPVVLPTLTACLGSDKACLQATIIPKVQENSDGSAAIYFQAHLKLF